MTKYIILFLMAGLAVSCNSDRIYENYQTIKGPYWNSKNILHFDVNIADTVHAYNIFILVRNTSRYEYSNLYLFVTAHSPNGNAIKDTVEVTLAADNGKWLGKGAASVYTVAGPYKMNVRFPYKGIYTFDIEQAMWQKNLRYISDIGMRVERVRVKSAK
jgi:gliding motility-associated lipoprotein GldH